MSDAQFPPPPAQGEPSILRQLLLGQQAIQNEFAGFQAQASIEISTLQKGFGTLSKADAEVRSASLAAINERVAPLETASALQNAQIESAVQRVERIQSALDTTAAAANAVGVALNSRAGVLETVSTEHSAQIDALAKVSSAIQADLDTAAAAAASVGVALDSRAGVLEATTDSHSAQLDSLARKSDALQTDIDFVAASVAATESGLGARTEVLESLSSDHNDRLDALVQADQDLQGSIESVVTEAAKTAVKVDYLGNPIRDEEQTTDATPTVVSTVSPISNAAMRLTAEVMGMRADGLEAAIYSIVALARAVPASEILTVSGVPNDGDQVETDGTTYTFKDTPVADTDVQRDAGTAEANIDNLVAKYNSHHPTYTASKAAADKMEVVAKVAGTGANGDSVTEPKDVSGTLSWGAIVTSGGLDMALFGDVVTVEHEDAAAWDVTIAVNGSDVEISVTGEADTTINWTSIVKGVLFK